MRYLLEEDAPQLNDILQAYRNGEITQDDLVDAVNNGEISEEDYNAVVNGQSSNSIEPSAEELIAALQNGEIQPEDLDDAVKNGEISEETYNEIIDQLSAEEQPQEEIPEDEMMAQEEQEPEMEPQPIDGKYKDVKLYQNFIALKQYIEIYKKAFNDIDISAITSVQHEKLAKLYSHIVKLGEDLSFYLKNSFTYEDYKKKLYSYLLFNNAFVEDVKKFRYCLKLNPDKLIAINKEKQEKINANIKKTEKK